MSVIRILNGSYRNEPVKGEIFTLVKGYQLGTKGGFVTVRNKGQFPGRPAQVRVQVDNQESIQYMAGKSETVTEPVVETVTESDEQAMNRIASRFSVLDEMSKACISGDIRAMIVTGPPGVGKSHGVHTQMEKASMFDKIAGKRVRFEVVKGAMSAIGLFALLYKYSDSKNVLVFDDCDVWEDQDALNILKAALDSGKSRRISYNKDSRLLRDEGVPNQFNFNGSIIFITNLNFSDRRSAKIKAHLEALQSRCHYLDLTINSERDKMLRIRQVHRDVTDTGGLFADYNFTEGQDQLILDFMWDNHNKLREVSLRMALKVADLVKISPNNWRELAKATCMKE
jgi:hypothetical protein